MTCPEDQAKSHHFVIDSVDDSSLIDSVDDSSLIDSVDDPSLMSGPDPDHPDQPDPTEPEHPGHPGTPEHPGHSPEPGLPAVPDPALPGLFAAARSGRTRLGLHPVLRTTMLVVWAALSGACADQSADPVRTAQAFTAAVQRGDMKAVLPLLELAAADRLAQAAAQASDQVGGRRSIEPAEMLQIVDVAPTFELARTELVDNDGATAHVRLHGAQHESYTLTLVQEDGVWHVRIPMPPAAPGLP